MSRDSLLFETRELLSDIRSFPEGNSIRVRAEKRLAEIKKLTGDQVLAKRDYYKRS